MKQIEDVIRRGTSLSIAVRGLGRGLAGLIFTSLFFSFVFIFR